MKIAIITGGETGEREVSINSANNIAEVIRFADVETFLFPEDFQLFTDRKSEFDLAIPMIHGAGGEDGALQLFLSSLQVPYLFSGIDGHKLGIDKHASKLKAKELGITVPEEYSKTNLLFPLFAKPRFGGSSLASQVCNTESELNSLLGANIDTEFIFEQPLEGREFTVGVIEQNNQMVALPVIEIISKSGFFDYESKYNPEKLAEEICPAKIDDNLKARLQTAALTVHKEFNLKHLSRCDFILTNNQIYFLEVNTIPGMTKTSLVPKMLTTANIDLESLLKEWSEET